MVCRGAREKKGERAGGGGERKGEEIGHSEQGERKRKEWVVEGKKWERMGYRGARGKKVEWKGDRGHY